MAVKKAAGAPVVALRADLVAGAALAEHAPARFRVLGEGGAGVPRADIVLGDRDGTSCDPAFTDFVRQVLAGFGYEVKVNDPFKGVELVRAYADPAAGRHSLQLEVNKRLYMDSATLERHAGFATLQQHLMALLEALDRDFVPALRAGRRARPLLPVYWERHWSRPIDAVRAELGVDPAAAWV